jgi:hypothetical protein
VGKRCDIVKKCNLRVAIKCIHYRSTSEAFISKVSYIHICCLEKNAKESWNFEGNALETQAVLGS